MTDKWSEWIDGKAVASTTLNTSICLYTSQDTWAFLADLLLRIAEKLHSYSTCLAHIFLDFFTFIRCDLSEVIIT